MKNKRSLLVTIIGILLLIGLVLNQFRVHMTVDYDISKNDNLINVKVNTYKGFKKYSADKVDIKIYNKYRTDMSIEKEVSELEKGEYNLYYYPQYSGDHIMNVSVEIDGKVISKQKEFKI